MGHLQSLVVFLIFSTFCSSLSTLSLERRHELLQKRTGINGMKEQTSDPVEGGTSIGLYYIELYIGNPPQCIHFSMYL